MNFPRAGRLALLALMLLLLIVSACATVQERQAPSLDIDRERERIVEYAASLLGKKELESAGQHFRSDCSGYVIGVYSSLGYRITVEPQPGDSSIAQALFTTLQKKKLLYRDKRPKKADLVFFKGTTEKRRYSISHIGLVAGVEEDETVVILHYSSRGVQELRMNLRRPGAHKDRRGFVINDFLKKGQGDNLSGQLFYSYGDIFIYTKL